MSKKMFPCVCCSIFAASPMLLFFICSAASSVIALFQVGLVRSLPLIAVTLVSMFPLWMCLYGTLRASAEAKMAAHRLDKPAAF